MKNRFLIGLSACLGCVSIAQPALAKECDPADFLKYEEVRYSNDLALQLNYLDALNRKKDDKTSSKGGFSYGPVDLTGENVREVSSSLKKELKFNFSRNEKTGYSLSKLSATGKDAYLGCLRDSRNNFELTLSGDPMASDEFYVIVHSTPKQPLPMRQRIRASVLGGRVVQADQAVLSTADATVTVHRDRSKYTTISVFVENYLQTISLPPAPNTINLEIRTSDAVFDDQYGGQGFKRHSLCVIIPNDEIDAAIVPGTLHLQKDLIENVKGYVVMSHVSYLPKRACASVTWGLHAKEGRVRGKAWVYAEVAKVQHRPLPPAALPQKRKISQRSAN